MIAKIVDLLNTSVAAINGEKRQEQETMLIAIAEAITNKQHLLVQAGTGTGKSLAYLLPLLEYSRKSETPTIVATATLSLQAQIFKKDLPNIIQAIPEYKDNTNVVLLKGKNNYACKYKTSGGIAGISDETEKTLFPISEKELGTQNDSNSSNTTLTGKEVTYLRKWVEKTQSGDRDDLEVSVSDKAWSQVSVNSYECLGANRCPMALECFSEIAKDRATAADIVVTNHALLALDTFSENSILPDYNLVVIDEAHELVDRTTSAVSGQLDSAMIAIAAAALKKHTAVSVDNLQEASKKFQDIITDVPEGLLHLESGVELFEHIKIVFDATKVALSDSKGDSKTGIEGGRISARAMLQEIYEITSRIISSGKNDVFWNSNSSIHVAPLNVADKLRQELFSRHTVIATSATLELGGNFDLLAKDLGIFEAVDTNLKWEGLDIGTPFDYKKQGILYVSKDLPRPGREIGEPQLLEILNLIQASQGGALLLFSSYNAARTAAEYLIDKVSFNILCQGDENLNSLIQKFSEDHNSCLLGTISLWQGVNVPGSTCRLVIIDRIPFPRPDDPLNIARTNAVTDTGRNGFMEISAKKAAIKLAQGAGRLIRSPSDKGVVAILDSRLYQAGYGKFLLDSLPDFWRTYNRDIVLSALKRLSNK